jgi:hypothetical protein
MQPLRIVGVCGAYELSDDWFIVDFCWLHRLFASHANVVEEIWLSGVDETKAAKELAGLKFGDPKNPRLTADEVVEERFSIHVEQQDLRARFLQAIHATAEHIQEGERLLVVVCSHGAHVDHVTSAGSGEEGDFLVGEDDTGVPTLVSQKGFLEAMEPMGENKLSLLTTSC